MHCCMSLVLNVFRQNRTNRLKKSMVEALLKQLEADLYGQTSKFSHAALATTTPKAVCVVLARFVHALDVTRSWSPRPSLLMCYGYDFQLLLWESRLAATCC